MCSNDGPSGSWCRAMVMGIEGLRYFIRGSISRQNFLGGWLGLLFFWCRWGFLVRGSRWKGNVPCASVAAVEFGVEFHADFGDFFGENQGAGAAAYP
jgi:hypothetical protein